MKQTLISLVAVAGVSFFAVHCGSNSSDCLDTRTCPDGTPDGGPNVDGGGDGGTVQPPAGCDPALDPKDAPKCVVSEYGVFVDGTGGNWPHRRDSSAARFVPVTGPRHAGLLFTTNF